MIHNFANQITSISSEFHNDAPWPCFTIPRGGGGGDDDNYGLDSVQNEALSLSSPKARAVGTMAIAMALHYFSYSIARPTTVALFTSKQAGFSSSLTSKNVAYPLAMACISPVSFILLLAYGQILDQYGPKLALRTTATICATFLGLSSFLISILSKKQQQQQQNINIPSPWLRSIVALLFIFRESYVQLITSQHWSFMSSVLTPTQSSIWFAPISGLTSLSSAASGFGVSRLVNRIGLTGALGCASIVLLFSALISERAYAISDHHGFNPNQEHKRSQNEVNNASKEKKTMNIVQKATNVFRRVPTLKALFIEVLANQGLTTLLNVCFVTKLSQSIPDDKIRAGWMGKFFALINVISGMLQFGALPKLMSHIEPASLWKVMPLITVAFTLFQCIPKRNVSLHLISATLMFQKIMEFSARRMLDEMIYVPLDFESRYVGKEVVGVLGYRFGKSGMSLILAGLTSFVGQLSLWNLSVLSAGAAFVWSTSTWNLSQFVSTRQEAEEAYLKLKAKSKK